MLKRNHGLERPGRRPGKLGKHPGGAQEVPRRHSGVTQEASRRHVGGSWRVPSRHPVGARGTEEAPSRQPQDHSGLSGKMY